MSRYNRKKPAMFLLLSPHIVMTDQIRRQHERELQNDFNLVWKLAR